MSSSDKRGVGDGGRGCNKHFKKYTMMICYMCNLNSFDLVIVIIEDFQARNWKILIEFISLCSAISILVHIYINIYISPSNTTNFKNIINKCYTFGSLKTIFRLKNILMCFKSSILEPDDSL